MASRYVFKVSHVSLLLLFLDFYSVLAQSESISSQSSAQSSHEVGLVMGRNFSYLQDLGYSPLNHHESGTLFSLFANRIDPQGRCLYSFSSALSKGTLKSDAGDFFNSKYLIVDIDLAVLWRISELRKDKISLYLGPEYNSFFEYIEWGDLESWSYIGNHGFHIKGLIHWDISIKSKIRSSFSFSLLGILVRPPYNGFNQHILENQDATLKLAFQGDLVSLGKFQSLSWQTTYGLAVSSHLDFIIAFQLGYKRVSGLTKAVRFENQITVGAMIKF